MTILLVEDNLAHQKITEYVLKRNNVKANIFVVRDGQEALDYLYHKNSYTDILSFPLPDLILLDLNLPKRDGREVLKVIKDDPILKDIPIVIVSTSDREEDVNYAFEHGVVAYISKSKGFDKYTVELADVAKYARVS
ncbi:MAG: response regulator [Ignavibacteriae bacterium]|nr:response regulator [Ignavibacteriota bacterium]